MPSTELGLAAIEERLRELCRRSNQRLALHAASVAASVIALSAALRIGLGAARFQGLPAWAALAACAITLVWAWRYTREHWLDVARAAELADRQAGMANRLGTVLAIAPRLATQRFFPVLLRQSLDLGERWQAQRLVPNSYPRTVYVALLSLLLLLGSPLLEPEAPPPSPQEGASSSPSTQSAHLPGGPEEPPQQQPVALASAGGSSDEPAEAGEKDGAGAKGGGAAAGGKQGLGERSGNSPTSLGKDSEPGSPAAAVRQGRAAAGSAGSSEPAEGGKAGEEKGEDREGNLNPPQEPDGRKSGEARGASKQSPGGQALPKPGSDAPPPPGLQAKQIAAAPPTNERKTEGTPPADAAKGDGSSGVAGKGTDGATLLTVRGSEASAQGASVGTFKLTLDSFLGTIANKDRDPRQGRKPGPEGPAEATVPVEGAERQMADDPMRKVPIPAEYEEIVKRVYARP